RTDCIPHVGRHVCPPFTGDLDTANRHSTEPWIPGRGKTNLVHDGCHAHGLIQSAPSMHIRDEPADFMIDFGKAARHYISLRGWPSCQSCSGIWTMGKGSPARMRWRRPRIPQHPKTESSA